MSSEIRFYHVDLRLFTAARRDLLLAKCTLQQRKLYPNSVIGYDVMPDPEGGEPLEAVMQVNNMNDKFEAKTLPVGAIRISEEELIAYLNSPEWQPIEDEIEEDQSSHF